MEKISRDAYYVQISFRETDFVSQFPHHTSLHYPMAVLHASQSILEKCAQTQGQTQVLMSQPAASVAAATQATHTTGISMVSTQAGGRWRGGQELMFTCARGEHDSITRPARR